MPTSTGLQALAASGSEPLPNLDPTPPWTAAGNCVDSYRLLDATLLPRSRKRSEAVDALTLLCDKCPVRQQCREYGIATKSWGIWGGVELQNGEIPRHRRPAPRPRHHRHHLAEQRSHPLGRITHPPRRESHRAHRNHLSCFPRTTRPGSPLGKSHADPGTERSS